MTQGVFPCDWEVAHFNTDAAAPRFHPPEALQLADTQRQPWSSLVVRGAKPVALTAPVAAERGVYVPEAASFLVFHFLLIYVLQPRGCGESATLGRPHRTAHASVRLATDPPNVLSLPRLGDPARGLRLRGLPPSQ